MFLHQVSASKRVALHEKTLRSKAQAAIAPQKGPPNCGTKGLRELSMGGAPLNSGTPAAYRVCLNTSAKKKSSTQVQQQFEPLNTNSEKFEPSTQIQKILNPSAQV
jgi:hypothetical protein